MKLIKFSAFCLCCLILKQPQIIHFVWLELNVNMKIEFSDNSARKSLLLIYIYMNIRIVCLTFRVLLFIINPIDKLTSEKKFSNFILYMKENYL